VDGLVLFNRFFQRDIDVGEVMDVAASRLSTNAELLLRLHWIASLRGRVRASLALSGGIGGPADGIKAILAGADVVQTVSGLIRNGPEFITTLLTGFSIWMEAHQIRSVSDARGRIHFSGASDRSAFERAAYLHTLNRK
jgi:dihydroorotate dehydrogenase (fumarate)